MVLHCMLCMILYWYNYSIWYGVVWLCCVCVCVYGVCVLSCDVIVYGGTVLCACVA